MRRAPCHACGSRGGAAGRYRERVKPRSLLAVIGVFLCAPLLAGCITINVPAPASSESSSGDGGGAAAEESDVDDSAARSAIGIAKGALFRYVETNAAEDCSFVAVIGQQAADATPLESYRGTYESIATNMKTIAQICAAGDPANVDGVNLAALTWQSVEDLLREWKNPLMGGNPPVPGNQAG
jgi:hypothetical protein